MQYPEENEALEQQIEDNVEIQNEAQEEYAEDNSPTFSKPEDLYSLFWKTIEIEDSSKVANLDKQELGMLDISVRDCQHIANTARLLGEEDFADWMTQQAEVILRTSASKKGWLAELFVTAKRFASKEKKMGINEPIPANPKQSFWDRLKR
jgi:hypothetical protein